MSSIYLVTNKVTHARMVVVAPNAEAARRQHPTCESAVREGRGWVRHVGGHFGRDVVTVPPPGWPIDLDLVDATVAGEAGRLFSSTTQVLAFERSLDLRQRGEGPDDSWGGYELEDCWRFKVVR